MKKYILYVTAILSLGALLTACVQKENNAEVAGGTQIRFSAQMGSFAVKADEAVTPDHVVGLFAAEPVAVSNTILNWVGSDLTPEAPIYWGQYQPIDEPVPFYAYTPYAQGTEMKFAFTVPADQSVEENFASADLMFATTLSSPKDEAVVLNFGHHMARLIITLDNRLGTQVAGLSFTGIVPTADVDLSIPSITLAKDVEPVEIKAAPVVLNDEQVAWALVFPAQTLTSSAVMVTTDEGEIYKVQASAVSFLEGLSYSATVILDEAAQSLNFSATVFDWLDQKAYFTKDEDPGKMEKHTWTLVQDNQVKAMELQEDGLYYAYFKEYVPYEFRIWRDYGTNTAMRYGFALEGYEYYLKDDETLTMALAPYAYCRLGTQDDAGIEVWFDEATKTATFKTIPHQWESMGMGTMVEAILSYFNGVPYQEVEVEFMEDKVYPGIIRVIDPYKNWKPESEDMYKDVENRTLPLRILEDNRVAIGTRDGYYCNLGSFGWYGDIFITTYSDIYGTYDPETGFIVFDKGIQTGYGFIDPENSVPLSFTLPGFTRPVTYCDIMNLQFSGFEDWGWGLMVRFGCQPQFEVKTIKAMAFAGQLNEDEIAGKVEEVKESGITFIAYESFYPGQWFDYSLFVPERGYYTIVLYSEAENGQSAYRFIYCYL